MNPQIQYPQNQQQGYGPIPQRNFAQQMPDPFQQNQGYQTNLPDIPISDPGAAMLNALLNDDVVPEEIRKEFWFVFHRDNTLTFLDEERKLAKLLSFDIIKIDSLNSTPYYDYTFEKEMNWNAARQMFEVKLDRALGNKSGKNERLTIPMTITENITRQVGETESQVKEGFLRRMLSRK